MLVRLERAVDLGAGVARRTVEVRSSTLHLQLIDASCGAFDSSALRRGPTPSLSLFTVPLQGTYVSCNTEREARVEPGLAVFEARSEWTERWHGPRQSFLVAYWQNQDGGTSSDFGSLRMGSAMMDAWQQLSQALRSATSLETQAHALLRARELMSHVGVVAPRVLVAPADPVLHRLAGALNASLTRMHEAPAWLDLSQQTGLGERQLRRVWREYAGYLPGSSFREALKQARLVSARHLLTGARAPPGEVARALGYGSTRALRTALAS